jgi:hypothetical protein
MENIRYPKLLDCEHVEGGGWDLDSSYRLLDGYSCEAETGHLSVVLLHEKKLTWHDGVLIGKSSTVCVRPLLHVWVVSYLVRDDFAPA